MALVSNGANVLAGLSRYDGAFGAAVLRGQFDKSGRFMNFDSGEHAISGVTNKASIPAGARHPIAWKMGTKAGSLASTNEAEGGCSLSLTLAAGRNISGLAEGSTPTAEATLQLVVSMVASALGEATTNANLNAALGLSGSAAGVSTDNAIITALAWAIGQSDGEATATLVSYATGRLQGSITPFTELSPEGLAAAVWNSLLVNYPDSGTAGNALANAGAGGNPWSAIIEDGMTAEEVLRVIASVLAGKVSGAGTGTETFVGLDGTTNRVISTVDNDGNRSSVIVDGT